MKKVYTRIKFNQESWFKSHNNTKELKKKSENWF